MDTPPIRWMFQETTQGQWRSRHLLDCGGWETSASFKDFGRCASDALSKGFKPTSEEYSLAANGRSTNYIPGSIPMVGKRAKDDTTL
jgi:hypothetical protein